MGKAPETHISSAAADYGIEKYYESQTNFPYPRSNYAMQLKRWKHRLADINADIFCAAEYNYYFGTLDGVNTNAREVVFGDYPYFYAPRAGGPAPDNVYNNNYHREAIFTMIGHLTQEWEQVTEVTMMNDPQTFVAVSFPLGSGTRIKTIHVVCTHPFHNGGNAPVNGGARTAMLERIIEKYANEDYVIVCGDFNVNSIHEFDIFADAGYSMANSSERIIYTFPASGCDANNIKPWSCLDNIIVKGFNIETVRLVNDPLLSDHCGLVSDLSIIV